MKILVFLGVLCGADNLMNFSIVKTALARHLEPKIHGGNVTTIERRPYMAALMFIDDKDVTLHCGASIISTKFLLTAGHCKPDEEKMPMFHARVGSSYYAEGGRLLKVASFLKHPLNIADKILTLDYDFGLVGLETGVELKLGPTVAVIALTEYKDPNDESLVTVSGWGAQQQGGIVSPILKEIDLPILPFATCKGIYKKLVSERNICMAGDNKGDSFCGGDSGSPAVQDGVQYALVTGGFGCGFRLMPKVFSKISSVRDWIREETGV